MSDPGLLSDKGMRTLIAEHANIIRSYTHAIVTTGKDNLEGFGTGVAFRLGGRLFLITAGHVIANPSFEVLFVSGSNRPTRAEVLNHHFHPDSVIEGVQSDMGFVELKNRQDISACEFEQLRIGPRIATQPTEETILMIAGFPQVGHKKIAPRNHELGLSVISGRLDCVEERILRLHYYEEGFSIGPNGERCEATSFYDTTKGFSGGGVWAFVKTNDNEMFDPIKHIKMTGTQYEWSSATRTMFAMRPRFTMPFFFESYPDLKAQYGHLIEGQLAK